MHWLRFRNKMRQHFYRPGVYRGRAFLPAQTLESLDAIDQAIEQKITPLLSGLWKD